MLSLISWTALFILLVAVVLGGAIFLILALRLYVYLSLGVCKSKSKMTGKTAIITGCTSGIGKETARDFAKRGARVIMACRNVENANKIKGFLFLIYTYIWNLINSLNLFHEWPIIAQKSTAWWIFRDILAFFYVLSPRKVSTC